jgi:endonuclease/exonuclease/phosphatase family metal-dependent hydrolase
MIGSCDNPPPAPTPPIEYDYTACTPDVSSSSFDIITWNIEHFPIVSTTSKEVANIILTSNVDLIAFQEVSSTESLDKLLVELPGWEGKISISGDINLGYLYKTSEVRITELTTLYDSLGSPFPRPPVVTIATHTSGLSATLINIHLKCCGGSDNIARRVEASNLIQQYIDSEKPNDPVIVLGDFNDEITSEAEPTPFQNFLDDPNDYRFIDMAIAQDEDLGWSYPSWPSHIDHLLITNELFDNVIEVKTLLLENCNHYYLNSVSDHRPVLMRLN